CGRVVGWLGRGAAVGGLAGGGVATLATVEARADEPGIVEAARTGGWPLVAYPADRLAAVAVPTPSEAVAAAVGTPSVAEAAAVLGGDGLVVAQRKSPMAPRAPPPSPPPPP